MRDSHLLGLFARIKPPLPTNTNRRITLLLKWLFIYTRCVFCLCVCVWMCTCTAFEYPTKEPIDTTWKMWNERLADWRGPSFNNISSKAKTANIHSKCITDYFWRRSTTKPTTTTQQHNYHRHKRQPPQVVLVHNNNLRPHQKRTKRKTSSVHYFCGVFKMKSIYYEWDFLIDCFAL